MATAQVLMTAEEFGRRPDPVYPEELVRGEIVPMPPAQSSHGQVCGQTYFLLRLHSEATDLGHVLTNDSGVITERDPDTVRGADIAFYRYDRVPRGPVGRGYVDVPPDLVAEVLSPDDRWSKVLRKVYQYVEAGVTAVVVLDPESSTAGVYRADRAPISLGPEDELVVADVLPDFQAKVSRFFE